MDTQGDTIHSSFLDPSSVSSQCNRKAFLNTMVDAKIDWLEVNQSPQRK